MTFDEILNQARKNAADIDKVGKRLGIDLASYFPTQLKQLNDCLDTYSAAKVVIATTIADASGELSLENAAKLAANFDKNWDKFAQEYNAIFSHLPGASKTNVLETFAKAHFGTKVFEAGSVIKNETPSILSGIVSFRAGINSFKGSFRNPQEAANKINNGVNLIVNSTAQVAGSLNNIVKFLQGGKSASAPGNVVLTKLSQLPQMKAVAAATSVLGISALGIAAVNTGSGAISALRKGDYATALSQGKATYENAKKVVDEVKKLKTGTMGAKPTPPIDGNKAPVLSAANGPQQPADKGQQQPASNNNAKDSSRNSDSYVCSTAKIKCSYGDRISTLTVYPDRTIWLTGQPQANISDHISMRNIAPFGRCHTIAFPPTGSATAANHGSLTPMPCMPNTPFPWMGGKDDVLLKGQPALLKSSKCKCIYGGTITFTYDGQIDGTGKDVEKENLESQENLDASAEVALSPEDLLDGLQIVLDAAGLFPGLGAIPDLLNACISACRGDWANAGLCLFAAIPGIGDAAGAAKLMKNGAKIAGKVSTKSVKTGKVVAKSPSNSNAVSIDSYKASAKRVNKTVNPSDTKSGDVLHQNFDDLSKRRAKNASIERQVEMKKVANSRYDGKYEYGYSTKNTTTNSIDKIGSSSSDNTGTYHDNPGSVIQEPTNTPRFGSATSKRSSAGNNHETDELGNLKKYEQGNGKNPFDENPSSIEKPKLLELTKKQPASAKTAPKSENGFSDLTKGDQWEIEKEHTWDNVKKSQEQSSWNPYTIKKEPDIPSTKVDNSIQEKYPSPEDVLKDNKMNKYGNFKSKPEYTQKQQGTGEGKKLDIIG